MIRRLNLRERPIFPKVKYIINIKQLQNDMNILMYSGISIESEDFSEEVYTICKKHRLGEQR